MSDDPADIVEIARDFARARHEGQLRDEGGPYFTHPEAVATILREHGHADPELIAAAYLHDVVEDTDTSIEEIRASFGDKVAGLVSEVTREKPPDSTFEQRQRALLQECRQMSQDARTIKLADRLHNLSTMNRAWPRWKIERYLNATNDLLDILADAEPAIAARIRTLAAQLAGTHP